MVLSYFISILVVVGIMVLWVVIQQHWKRAFAENVSDEDVLAGRNSCGNCGCMGVGACIRRNDGKEDKDYRAPGMTN